MRTFVKYATCFISGATIGSIVTYILTHKKISDNAESEIANMRSYFDRKMKEFYDKKSENHEEAEEFYEKAHDGLKKYVENRKNESEIEKKSEDITLSKSVEDRLAYNNHDFRNRYATAFDERSEEDVMEDELERYYAEKESPKDDQEEDYRTIISEEEYAYGEEGWYYETLRFHPTADLFTDANTGDIIDDPDRSLGSANVDYIHRTDKNTVYIRNERLKIVYEIEILSYLEDDYEE